MNVDLLVQHLSEHGDMPLSAAIDWLCQRHQLDPDGDLSVSLTDDENIVLDAGLSEDGVEAMRIILAAALDRTGSRLTLRPFGTDTEAFLVYSVDGARMQDRDQAVAQIRRSVTHG